MSVGIRVGSITDEIGSSDFLHAFFSTISSNLETNGWGSRFPVLLKNLYQGSIDSSFALDGIAELNVIKTELTDIPPEKVVWDIEDSSKIAPWGDHISPDINSLANYFVTSTGRDLISTLIEALDDAAANNKVAKVVQC